MATSVCERAFASSPRDVFQIAAGLCQIYHTTLTLLTPQRFARACERVSKPKKLPIANEAKQRARNYKNSSFALTPSRSRCIMPCPREGLVSLPPLRLPPRGPFP